MSSKLLTALVVVGFLLGSVFLLWISWQADESQKPVQTSVVEENNDDGTLTVEVKLQQKGEHIVCCNEDHFEDAHKHLKKFAEVKDRTIDAPGGAMLIALADIELHEDLHPAKRVLIEVLKRHSPKRLVLVAHEECLIYDSIGAWQDRPEEVKALQIRHLLHAQEILNEWFPKTQVDLYYGEKTDDTHMRFYRVYEDSFFEDSPEFSTPRLGESQASDNK